MVTTPVSVVTYAMVAGDVAIRQASDGLHQIVEGAVRKTDRPDASRPQSQPPVPNTCQRERDHHHRYHDPAVSRVLVGGGDQQQRQMIDRMEETGDERRTPPRGELSDAKEQVAAPADLFAKEDDRENDRG